MVQDDAVIYMPVSNTSENNGNDTEQNQVLIQTEKQETLQETDDKNTPGDVLQTAVTTPADLRTLLAKWWKVILGITVIIGIVAGIAWIGAVIKVFTDGNGNSSQQPHNRSLEVNTKNTTSNYQVLVEFAEKYCLPENTKITSSLSKEPWLEAKKICEEKEGQLLTLKDPKRLEALRKCLSNELSYWVGARCAHSGTCTWTDDSRFIPSRYNASLPRHNRESCLALVSGKFNYEMCGDNRRFLCEFPTEH